MAQISTGGATLSLQLEEVGRQKEGVAAEESDDSMQDEYSEAWYDLGAPIQLPLLKYLISTIQYVVDNFFLIKNTYNALTYTGSEDMTHPKIIAAAILGLHLISAFLISIIDSLNKDAISGSRGKYLNKKHKSLILFRLLAHLTLTMKLFRYTTAFLENRRRNQQLHILRMRRVNISRKEIQFVVDQKKNQLVESHYDLVESFFKTVPAALLQVFFMFETNRNAKLRLYSTVDQDRFATVFFTIITASISAANYQVDYLTYKKVLHFQDCFRSGFRHQINLKIPGDIFLIANIPVQILTIGIRMCFYSILIFWSPVQFFITMSVILLVNWLVTFYINQTAWRFRPVLENPLYGIPWLCFDIIDLWINLFIPGVHYPKPVDHFLNFYTTLITGIVIFRGFDFLTPATTSTAPQFFPISDSTNSSSNISTIIPQSFIYASKTGENNSTEEAEHDSVYFIGTLIQRLVTIHEYLTFNQISYAGFFYNVVKYMNIINLISFGYTCLMNYLHLYDLDFPIQIVNNFYLSMFNSLNKSRLSNPDCSSHLLYSVKDETFIIFSMLPNSRFFRNLQSIKKRRWDSFDQNELDKLVDQLEEEGNTTRQSSCLVWLDKFLKSISPVLYPARFREAKFNWDIPTDKFSIIRSLQSHPLREQIIMFINDFYEHAKEDRKLLLAVFCANYNEIVRHYTSLRLKKTFQFFDIPIEKGKVYCRPRTPDGQKIKYDYELGHLDRIIREIRGKVKDFPSMYIRK